MSDWATGDDASSPLGRKLGKNLSEAANKLTMIMSQCVHCGGDLAEHLTTFVYEDSDQYWIVRNVPAFVCTRCGEKEYTQETTRRVLALLAQPPRPREILHVPAYELAAA